MDKNKSSHRFYLTFIFIILAVIVTIFVLGTRYASKTENVNAKVAKVEAEKDDEIAEIKEKDEKQIAKLEEKIAKPEEEIAELRDQAVLLEKISKTISTEELEFEINKIGELATVEYWYTDASKFSDQAQIKDFKIPFTKNSFIATWSGTIKAGIDLEKIECTVDEKNKTITISLPKSEILSNEFDSGSLEVIDETNNVLNNISVDDFNTFLENNKDAMKEKAIQKGLLEKADANARAIIENSLLSNTVINQNYELIIETKEETEKTTETSETA